MRPASEKHSVMFGYSALALLALMTLARGPAAAAQDLPYGPGAPGSPGGAKSVPAWTIVPLELKNTINSRTAFVGQAIYCETLYPVTENDRILIPAHSYVKGSVADVVKPGHIKGKAQLSLRIDSITLPDGTTRSLQATVFSLAGSRLSSSKSEEELAEPAEGGDIAVSGGQDAIVDATGLGGPSPISAVSEGVGGLVVMLVTRGKTIILRPGTTLEIQLTAPLGLGRPRGSGSAGRTTPPPLAHRPSAARASGADSSPQN